MEELLTPCTISKEPLCATQSLYRLSRAGSAALNEARRECRLVYLQAFDATLLHDIPSGSDGKRIDETQSERKTQYGLAYRETRANDKIDQRGPSSMIVYKNELLMPLQSNWLSVDLIAF